MDNQSKFYKYDTNYVKPTKFPGSNKYKQYKKDLKNNNQNDNQDDNQNVKQAFNKDSPFITKILADPLKYPRIYIRINQLLESD
jgi:hypothetical protein